MNMDAVFDILKQVAMDLRSEAVTGGVIIVGEMAKSNTLGVLKQSDLPSYKTRMDTSLVLGFANKLGFDGISNRAVVICEVDKDGNVVKNDLAKDCDDAIYSLLSANKGVVIVED